MSAPSVPPAIHTVLDEHGQVWAWYARGQHAPALFAATLAEQYGLMPPVERIKHDYWRWVPNGDGAALIVYVSAAGRGAGAVTAYYADDGRPTDD